MFSSWGDELRLRGPEDLEVFDVQGSGIPAESDKLKLTDLAEAAFERAVSTGEEKDVTAAVRAIYAAARSAVNGREAYQDPVVLAFLVELAGRMRKIEEKVGFLQVPPRRDGPIL